MQCEREAAEMQPCVPLALIIHHAYTYVHFTRATKGIKSSRFIPSQILLFDESSKNLTEIMANKVLFRFGYLKLVKLERPFVCSLRCQ